MKNVNGMLVAIMFREPLAEGFSFFNLTAKFKEEFKELFGDIDPISVLTGGQPAPPEVPRYILQNKEDIVSEFSFSGIRFDFRISDIKDFQVSFVKDNLQSIKSILEQFPLPHFRIGVVLDGDIKMNDGEFFLANNIDMNKVKDSEEIQFSYRNIILKKGYSLNEWIKYGALTKDTVTRFEIDINTMDSISLGMIDEFGDIVSEKIGEFIEH